MIYFQWHFLKMSQQSIEYKVPTIAKVSEGLDSDRWIGKQKLG